VEQYDGTPFQEQLSAEKQKNYKNILINNQELPIDPVIT
jgi:hypothetical protein